MRRRSFLTLAGLGAVASGIGSLTYRISDWWDQPSTDHTEVLSEEECSIARAIADAMFPGEDLPAGGLPNGVEAGVVDHLDEYLATIDARSSRLLRTLLHIIDEFAIFRGLRFQPFRARSREERIEILKNWDTSPMMLRRKAFRSLKLVFAGGYCTDEQVLQAAGIDFRCGGVG